MTPIPPSALPVVEILRRDVPRLEPGFKATVNGGILNLGRVTGSVYVEYSIAVGEPGIEFAIWWNENAAEAMDAIWPE
jgi:hypothetical protein